MGPLIVLALALAAPAAETDIVVDGESFGPKLTLTCSWFTNFENSRFDQCSDGTRKLLPTGESASIKCAGDSCRKLDAAARAAAGWNKPETLDGTFTVTLIGRIGKAPHAKRYIGDGTRTILLEDVQSVVIAK
jgi:hypothetical protein